MVTEQDENILKHLTVLTVSDIDGGFRIALQFAANDYFSDKELWKEFRFVSILVSIRFVSYCFSQKNNFSIFVGIQMKVVFKWHRRMCIGQSQKVALVQTATNVLEMYASVCLVWFRFLLYFFRKNRFSIGFYLKIKIMKWENASKMNFGLILCHSSM